MFAAIVLAAAGVVAQATPSDWRVALTVAPSTATVGSPFEVRLSVTNETTQELGIVLGDSHCGYRFSLTESDTGSSRVFTGCKMISFVSSRGQRIAPGSSVMVRFRLTDLFTGLRAGRYVLREDGFIQAGIGYRAVPSNTVSIVLGDR